MIKKGCKAPFFVMQILVRHRLIGHLRFRGVPEICWISLKLIVLSNVISSHFNAFVAFFCAYFIRLTWFICCWLFRCNSIFHRWFCGGFSCCHNNAPFIKSAFDERMFRLLTRYIMILNRTPNCQAINFKCRLAHTDRNTLAFFATGPNAAIKLHVVAYHADTLEYVRAIAD